MRELYKGAIFQGDSSIIIVALLDASGVPVTGKTFSDIAFCKYSRDGEAPFNTFTLNGVNFTEIADGFYKLILDGTVTAFDGVLNIYLSGATFDDILYSYTVKAKDPGNVMVTLTVNDQIPINLANTQVDIWDSGMTTLLWSNSKNSSGQVVLSLNPGIYKVLIRKSRVSFTTPETLTVVGPTAETATFSGTSVIPSSPTAPNLCVIYGSIYDIEGAVDDGTSPDPVIILAQRGRSTSVVDGRIYTNDTSRTKPDEDGYFEVELVRNMSVTISIERSGINKKVTVPDQVSAALTSLL